MACDKELKHESFKLKLQ